MTIRVRLAPVEYPGGGTQLEVVPFEGVDARVGQEGRLDLYRGDVLVGSYPEGAWIGFESIEPVASGGDTPAVVPA
jgi:hypothetical protein